MMKYQKAIDYELSQRLNGNAHEVGVILNDAKINLQQKRDRYVRDPNLIYHLAVRDSSTLTGISTNWLKRQHF